MPDWTARIVQDVDDLDVSVFEALATTDSPLLDRLMPRLTDAADHSKLWLGIAALLGVSRKRRAQRAAMRGVATIAMSSLITNQIAKRTNRRPRPSLRSVPLSRMSRRLPTSTSFPSGHASSAAAFVTAVSLELPALAYPLRALAGLVGVSRVATGAHYPSDVVAGWFLGSTVARIGGKLVPPAAPPEKHLHHRAPLQLGERPTGRGVVLVVNPASHSGQGADVLRKVQRKLADVEVVELRKEDDVEQVMRESASRAEVLGVAGGDGTVRSAAAAAIAAGVPLAVFPAGTFNHFAKDVGAFGLDAAITAVKRGTADKVDAAYLNDEIFLNTASIGAYTDFVEIREKYEGRIGKPLAAAWAALVVKDRNLRVRVDDTTSEINLLFLGNGKYQPSGFAPAFREQMSDGLVDLRMLDVAGPFGQLKVLAALLTGQLARNKRYHELSAPEMQIDILNGPVRVARDGELGEMTESLRVRADRRALTVFCHDAAF
ncbi:bifunctional phosphatase PAP2/diacylglycerol kinase family protein [Flexivirga meconopsidis]|uniref:bifunctional phosphatase PAP2/diacylglycerol kinase family protein n=1 Tax=Flexivirga meconopsidis TaxID=2977121 RepID=UPI00223EFC94|nr:phosphatase PAP2 family protein [Flexivirga meconopsidis]